MIKQWLREYLGISFIASHVFDTKDDVRELRNEVISLKEAVRAILPSIGRVIAKLEPIFSTNESDPNRKAESDKIGKAAIDKIIAEDKARRHSLGDL